MFYYKKGSTYIASETVVDAEAITEEEYMAVRSIIDNRPTSEAGFAYRLTADLQWELYEVPATEEITEAEALEILLGGVV